MKDFSLESVEVINISLGLFKAKTEAQEQRSTYWLDCLF